MLDVARDRRRQGLPATIIYTSSTWVLGHQPSGATEDTALRPTPFVAWRLDTGTDPRQRGTRPLVYGR